MVSIEFKILSLRRVSLLAYSPLAMGILFGKYFSPDGGPADAHLNLFEAYALSLIFLTLFTIAAIIGCVVLYTGQGKFHTSTSNTLDYVVWQANTTVESLGGVLDYLEAAKHIRVDQLFLPPDVQNNINKGSSIGLVKSMQPAISNPASADSVISSNTDPNLCFATHAHSSISFSGLSVENSAADHQDWCFSNGSHGRAASIVS